MVQAEGYPVPELPLWGRKGDITEFHLENKYEVLAICFRTKVESFLIAFDKHYNFLTKNPQSADLVISSPIRDLPPHLPTIPITTSVGNFQKAERDSKQRSPVVETRLETGGLQNRCQSNLYNLGSNELNDLLR